MLLVKVLFKDKCSGKRFQIHLKTSLEDQLADMAEWNGSLTVHQRKLSRKEPKGIEKPLEH